MSPYPFREKLFYNHKAIKNHTKASTLARYRRFKQTYLEAGFTVIEEPDVSGKVTITFLPPKKD